eukprot:TRINITY_DN2958_c0_g5_i1.p1 TRINITY_DN2958_c0_g5~~TRINITY_DN2958_c0_g5_i1.p1  ORF type:complete len:614 (+),score=178.02 TRINITY_DN2958_c0_g5_i1:87-1928(+)
MQRPHSRACQAGCGRQWVPDEAARSCCSCGGGFSLLNRRHHCRRCGQLCCGKCSRHRRPLPLCYGFEFAPQRVCDGCAKASQQFVAPARCGRCVAAARRASAATAPVAGVVLRSGSARTHRAKSLSSRVRIALDGEVIRPGVCRRCGGVRREPSVGNLAAVAAAPRPVDLCVSFFDRVFSVELCFTASPAGGLRYRVDGAERPDLHRIVFDQSDLTLRFPELCKGCTLPQTNTVEVLRGLRRLAEASGCEHNIAEDPLAPLPPPPPLDPALLRVLDLYAASGWEVTKADRRTGADVLIEHMGARAAGESACVINAGSGATDPAADAAEPLRPDGASRAVRATADLTCCTARLLKVLSSAGLAEMLALPASAADEARWRAGTPGRAAMAAAAAAIQRAPVWTPVAGLLSPAEAAEYGIAGPAADADSPSFRRRATRHGRWRTDRVFVAAVGSARLCGAVVVPLSSVRSRVTLVVAAGAGDEEQISRHIAKSVSRLSLRLQGSERRHSLGSRSSLGSPRSGVSITHAVLSHGCGCDGDGANPTPPPSSSEDGSRCVGKSSPSVNTKSEQTGSCDSSVGGNSADGSTDAAIDRHVELLAMRWDLPVKGRAEAGGEV